MKKQNLKFRMVFLITLISSLFIQCGNYQKDIKKNKYKKKYLEGLGNSAQMLLLKKLLVESKKSFTVDFSSINENLYEVLRYREVSTKKKLRFWFTNSSTKTNFSTETNKKLFPFPQEKEEVSDWKKIPSDEEIKVKEGSYIEISLKDSIILGKEKITSDTKIKIKDIMGSDKKVKNFKYLVLSLSSEKFGELSIPKKDLKELKDKKIDFDQNYTDFKEDEKVEEILTDKIAATDYEVEDFKVDN